MDAFNHSLENSQLHVQSLYVGGIKLSETCIHENGNWLYAIYIYKYMKSPSTVVIESNKEFRRF